MTQKIITCDLPSCARCALNRIPRIQTCIYKSAYMWSSDSMHFLYPASAIAYCIIALRSTFCGLVFPCHRIWWHQSRHVSCCEKNVRIINSGFKSIYLIYFNFLSMYLLQNNQKNIKILTITFSINSIYKFEKRQKMRMYIHYVYVCMYVLISVVS